MMAEYLNDETHGYVVATDVLERLERLVSILSEPLVAFAAELSGERDDALDRAQRAEALNARLVKGLAYLVDAFPATSWATSNEALDAARATLAEIEQEGATIGSADQPTDQETDTHGTTAHRHPDSTEADAR